MTYPPLPPTVLEPIIRLALAEDFGVYGDVTANLLVPETAKAELYFKSRDAGVLAGLQAAAQVFAMIDTAVTLTPHIEDGAHLEKGTLIATLSGPVRSLLMGERTAINFMGRLSGIATLTSQYTAKTSGTKARITATRKTTPGLRALEKRAVLAGGGASHRGSLSDAIMIKDNHIALAGGIDAALKTIKDGADHMCRVSVEVDSLVQLEKALPFAPDVVLLDNMSLEQLRRAVEIADAFNGHRPVLEASGGVNLSTVADIAQTGVDIISVGALTHSSVNFDIGLDADK